MAAVVDRSLPQLSLFKPDALSGLVLALGAGGHAPVPQLWLDRACLEVYIRWVGLGWGGIGQRNSVKAGRVIVEAQQCACLG
jgi:hypothetical protein